VEQWNPVGPPLVEVNASEVIDGILGAHNQSFGCEEDGTTGSTGEAVDDGDGEGPGSGVDSGEGTSGGTGGGSGGIDVSEGCGCSSGGTAGGWLFGVVVMAIARRRRA
jgi:MYXO-CTERM domain-containing protein